MSRRPFLKGNKMEDLRDKTPEELRDWFGGMGEKPFRANQLFRWIARGATDFETLTDMPQALRARMAEQGTLQNLSLLECQVAGDGTRKYLFQLADGQTVEAVLMKYAFGATICLSSQVGCGMGCSFCASALGGLVRNLTAGEMIGQVLEVRRESGIQASHLVVMGTGEPLANLDNLLRFIALVHHKDGMNLSLRNITVSTCGLVPAMEKFAEAYPQVNLAVSLHAPEDGMRSRMMPVNDRWPVDELLAACRRITARTGRRITFEYALVRGVNDREETIDLLARKLRGMLCHVNLIPLNPVAETGLSGSPRSHALAMAARLEAAGIPATVRREMGSDIEGACGQLRHRIK